MTPNCLFFYLFTGSLLLIHTALLPQAFRYLRNGSRLQDIPRDIREFLRPPPHRLLGRFPLPALSPAGTMALGIALTLCLLTALISPAELLTRIALGIAGVVSLLYFPQLHDLNFVRRKANTVPVILFILSAAPGISPAPQSPVAAWPVLAAGILAVQVYFSAGVEKIRASGFSWARVTSSGGPSLNTNSGIRMSPNACTSPQPRPWPDPPPLCGLSWPPRWRCWLRRREWSLP